MTMQDQEKHTENNTVELGNQTGSGLARPTKSSNKKLGVAVMLLGLLGVGVIAAPYFLGSFSSEDEEKQPEKNEVKTTQDYKPPVVEESNAPKVFTFDEPTEEAPIERLGDPVPQVEAPQAKLVKSLSGEMMNKIGGGIGSMGGNPEASYGADKDDQIAVENAIAQANAYLTQSEASNQPKEKIEAQKGDIFSAPTFEATVARKSRYNPNLLLEQGTLIPCALRVRVISNISGQLSCTITENVYSSNGNVLLIDKGSRVNGYYQGGSVQHGSKQLFVVWQEVRTPDHLVIPLNSGSTDELGANGLNGWVDNHFWDRFSNAIFLSMILDGNNILLNKMTDSAARNSENTREAGKEIATTVLEQMGDIKPTLYKNQGDKIGIFVARDVDFSGVYQLKRSR